MPPETRHTVADLSSIPLLRGLIREGTGNYMVMKCSRARVVTRVGSAKDNTILLAGEFNRQMQAANDDEDDELVAACTGTGACTDTGGEGTNNHTTYTHTLRSAECSSWYSIST